MYCYIHYMIFGNGERSHQIFDELYRSIKDSGLLDKLSELRVFTVGNSSKICTDFSTFNKCVVIGHSNRIHDYEFPTLMALHSDAVKMEKETPILYLHLKGVTSGSPNDNHRQAMLNIVIRDHERCISSLGEHNSCGTHFLDHLKFEGKIARHYSGNFWWSKSDHISKLPVPSVESLMRDYGFLVKGRTNKNCHSPKSHNHRYLAEFWIGLHDMGEQHSMCGL